MRNRLKCKLCKDVIESLYATDINYCKCGEIGVHGGEEHYGVRANDFANLIRIDDQDNEIIVTVKEKEDLERNASRPSKPSKEDLLELLDGMIKNIENLPPNAMHTYITHYDLCSALLLISSLFRADCKEEI